MTHDARYEPALLQFPKLFPEIEPRGKKKSQFERQWLPCITNNDLVVSMAYSYFSKQMRLGLARLPIEILLEETHP